MTFSVAVVLRAFLAAPDQPRYGYDLMRECGFGSGKLYPILGRLEKAGWLDRDREDVDASAEGRPPRVLYRLTALGESCARRELASLAAQFGPLRLTPQWGLR